MVGTALMQELQRQHIPFAYLSTSREKLVDRHGGKGFYWNPSLGEIDMNAMDGITHILNLAGANVAKRWTPAYKKEILQSRIETAETLKKAIGEVGAESIEKYVSASGIAIYPSSRTRLYTEELDEPASGFLSEVVQAWEAAAMAIQDAGVPVSILRIGLVLSREGGAFPKILQPIKFGVGAAFGNGEQWQSWIHIQDLVAMFRYVLEEDLPGVYNAAAPNPVSQEKLVRAMAEVAGMPLWLPPIPAFVLKLAMGEMSSVLLESQRVSSQKIQQSGFEFRFTNIRNAVSDLLGK